MNILKQIVPLYERFGRPILTNFQVEEVAGNHAYRAGVFTLADTEGRVVMIRRKPQSDYPGLETYWWLPGGGHEPGEWVDETAVREFREETGLEVQLERLLVAILGRSKDFFYFFFRGHVVGGGVSHESDPDHSIAEVRCFAPAEIPVEAVWSDIDKILLVQAEFINYPVDDLLLKYDLQKQST
ncbi:MAG: NUDIX domain-containing protein [Chloroflexota bacterium]